MLQDGFSHATDDVHVRALREEIVDGQRLVEAIDAALKEDQDLLEADELEMIQRKVEALKVLISESKDVQVIRRSVESLSKSTDEFAAKRMNKSIKLALAGKKVEDI